jgi:amino-acid N-acetyltransferase
MSPAVAVHAERASPSEPAAARMSRREPASAVDTRALVLRAATAADADAIFDLIDDYRGEGHLLPRSLDEIRVHAHRFVVAATPDAVIGCADLAPLSRIVAEVRSLVVAAAARHAGVGRQLIDDLVRRASSAGFDKLCAFTHAPAYFVELGFSIVPHVWLPEKIQADCRSCAQFRACGQYAVMLPLARTRHSCVPLASLHG